MNLATTRVVLRLRTVPEVLDLAFPFCARSARVYARLGLVLLAPALALCAAARWLAHVPWSWVWPLAIALGGILQGAFTVAAGRLLFDEKPRVRDVLARWARRLPSHLGALLVTRIAMALAAAIVLLIPSVWVRALFVHEVVLLEDAGPFGGFGRAARFVRRQEVAGFGLLLALVAAQAGFVFAAEALGAGLVRFVLQLGEPFGSLLEDSGSLYALGGFFFSVPYVASARFLKYIDVRTRKEGWDIRLRFNAIAAADEPTRAGDGPGAPRAAA